MALTSDLKEPEIRYGSLDYGEYTFQAEAIMIWDRKSVRWNIILP